MYKHMAVLMLFVNVKFLNATDATDIHALRCGGVGGGGVVVGEVRWKCTLLRRMCFLLMSFAQCAAVQLSKLVASTKTSTLIIDKLSLLIHHIRLIC